MKTDSTLVEAEAQVALYSNSLYQYMVQVAGLNPDGRSPSEKQEDCDRPLGPLSGDPCTNFASCHKDRCLCPIVTMK